MLHLSTLEETLLKSLSTWTGVLVGQEMPERDEASITSIELVDRVKKRIASSEYDLQETLKLATPGTLRGTKLNNMKALIHRDGRKFRGNEKWDTYVRPWSDVLLCGYQELGKDLSAFNFEKKPNTSEVLNMWEGVFFRGISTTGDMVDYLRYNSSNDKIKRITYQFKILSTLGFLYEDNPRPDLVGTSHIHTVTAEGDKFRNFFASRLHPLLRYTRSPSNANMKKQYQRLVKGDFTLRQHLVLVKGDTTPLDETLGQVIYNPTVGTPMFRIEQLNGQVDSDERPAVYVSDIRGQPLSFDAVRPLSYQGGQVPTLIITDNKRHAAALPKTVEVHTVYQSNNNLNPSLLADVVRRVAAKPDLLPARLT